MPACPDLVEYFTVNARGQAMEERYGNGTIMTRMFDAQSGRLESVLTEQGMTEIRHDTYKWRSDGLLESRADETGSTVRRESFAHDRLGRLTSATAPLSGGGSRTLSMTYDKIGNLKTRSSSVTGDLDRVGDGPGQRGPRAPGPTAATTITVGAATHALSYDTGGRVKRDDDQSTGGVDRYFDWNARGLLKKVVAGDSLTDTTPEGGRGIRVRGRTGHATTVSPPGKTTPTPTMSPTPSSTDSIWADSRNGTMGRSDLPKVRVETTRIGGAILHTRTTTTTEDPQDSESEGKRRKPPR